MLIGDVFCACACMWDASLSYSMLMGEGMYQNGYILGSNLYVLRLFMFLFLITISRLLATFVL